MKKRILDLMESAKYQPMNRSELARTLNLRSDEKPAMRKMLAQLERQGKVKAIAKGRYIRSGKRPSRKSEIIGTVKFVKRGGALFFADLDDVANQESGLDLEKYKKVFIPSKGCGTALDGDRVAVSIGSEQKKEEPKWKKHRKGQSKRGDKKREGRRDRSSDTGESELGKVVRIIERKMDTFIARYHKRGKFSYCQPEDALLPNSMDVTDALDAKPGQVVVVRLVKWDNFFDTPLCEVVEVVGWPEDPGVDIMAVIHKHRLRQEFPDFVIDEAKRAHERGVPQSEIDRRDDWRDRLVITIDPFDAKDFDDAISVVKKEDGGWKLAVHIADVSHYVRENSELDKEAAMRGNSTYLVDRVLPMLPEELCNDICSLKPRVDRLTKCAIIDIAADGEIQKWKLVDAVIHSKYRLSYEEAQEILESDKTGELEDFVKEAWKMSSTLRKRRFNEGSLDLEFPEVKVILDDKFVPIRVDNVVHNESHKLIEECMLLANEVVAVSLKRSRTTSVYRIHETPDFDKLSEFTELARSHGFEPGDLSNKKHVQKLIEDIKGHPSEQSIKIGLLKSLKRAAYSVEALGHYGLGKMDYAHFTSPIRRYADLIVHRGVQSLLENRPEKPARVPKVKTLVAVADHISETERTSAAAESETKKMKLMEYLWRTQQSGEKVEFDGVITECRRMGAFVEILDVQMRALAKIEDFPRGDWRLEEGLHRYSASGNRQIGLGQKVKVRLVKVDPHQQEIDVAITEYE